jgi:hypothetical protein
LRLEEGITETFALLDVGFGDAAGEFTHAAEEGLTFGHADGAARVEDVEGVRAFEDVVVGRQDEAALQAGAGFGVEEVVHLAQARDVGNFKVVFAVLVLFGAADFAVGHARAPGFVPDGFGVVEGDEDALETIGDFDSHGVKGQAADLLEVGELGDFLAIEPDFPAQAPGGDGGLFPVVFDEADVVLARVNADGFERLEVEFLWVAGVGLEDDLVLVMYLEAVGVLAVAPIVGADGGFDVGDVPGFGSQHAQEGGGVHRSGTDLGVVGLGDEAAVRGPEVLEGEDEGLEGGGHSDQGSVLSVQ